MKKQVYEHKAHLEITLERLISLLFTSGELDIIYTDKEHWDEHLPARSAWIKAPDLVIPGVTTEFMVLAHLLWFQSIGRVIIEDIDPRTEAIRLHYNLPKEKKSNPSS